MNDGVMRRGRVLYIAFLVLSFSLFAFLLTYHNTGLTSALTNPIANRLTNSTFAAAPEIPPTSSLIGSTNCRYGVAADYDQAAWLPTVGAGWYINFGTASSAIPDTEFVQFITIHQNKNGTIYLPSFTVGPALTESELGAVVDANPGHLWVVGNEIERVGQGDIYPDIYAIAYHDVYHFIKQRDPSAQVAVAALVQVTPARLAYLDLVWDAYLEAFDHPMPVDVWTFHLYILPEVMADGVTPNGIANIPLGVNEPPNPPFSNWRRESGGSAAACAANDVYCFAEHTDMPTFKQQVVNMREWLKEHGQQEKPLLLTEFSVLYPYILDPGGSCFIQDEYGNCFTPQRVSTFMQQTFNYLDGPESRDPNLGYSADGGRLVQQWLWYKMWVNSTGDVSNLLNSNYTSLPAGSINALSPIGQQHRNLVTPQTLNVNLFPYQYNTTQINNDTVDIHIQVMNNGNTEATGSFNVSLYTNPNHTGLIGTATLSGVEGCVRDNMVATIRWSGLATGSHTFYGRIDATNQIPETNEQDNFINGFVLVNPDRLFLPQVVR